MYMYMYMNTGTYKSGLTLPFCSEPPWWMSRFLPPHFLSEPFEKYLSYPLIFCWFLRKRIPTTCLRGYSFMGGGGWDQNKNAKSHSPLQGQATGDVPSRQISTLSCTSFLLKNTKNRNLSCILIHHFRVLISFLFFSSGFSCQQKIVECLPDHLSC